MRTRVSVALSAPRQAPPLEDMVTVLSVWTNYTIGIEHIDGTGAIPQRGCDRDSGMDETAFNRCVCVFVCVCVLCVCVRVCVFVRALCVCRACGECVFHISHVVATRRGGTCSRVIPPFHISCVFCCAMYTGLLGKHARIQRTLYRLIRIHAYHARTQTHGRLAYTCM